MHFVAKRQKTKQNKTKDQGLANPFEDTLPQIIKRLPTWSHHLKIISPPKNTSLRTKPLIHRPLGVIQDPKYSPT